MEIDEELSRASGSRGLKALLCLGFRNGEPCAYKALNGGTICKTANCIAYKANWPGHHAQYLSFRDAKKYDQASHWRTTCQAMYSQQYQNHLTQIQADNMSLMYAENLQLAIETAQVQAKLSQAERSLASLRTMSLPELLATQDANATHDEYGVHTLPISRSVAQLVEEMEKL
jgi:hypothetical protein